MRFEEPAADDQYEPVTGKDAQTVKCVRACEAEAAAKTASDHEHIIWAYGVIWALFAAYGVFLWRRSVLHADDLAELQRRLDRKA
ncbi:MAG TPA: hypothetical protein VFG69_00900 [Nannocystaceae bacterium]|nr:hypothetical protein [Nannocystaceae bacterium]